MKDLKDKVAVVTGGASGIGRAIAERLAAEGMRLVLADIEEGALAAAQKEMEAQGATVVAVRTDVSQPSDVEALAKKSVDAFGAVHVLCNNAGVGPPGGPLWERSVADWQWVLGVNLWGVIHGIRVFVPIMRAQDTECHIVNTASLAGLVSVPWMGIYNVTKHAIVTLSETLHHELTLSGTKLKISVLCPAWVNTALADSDRNRPAGLTDPGATKSPQSEMVELALRQFLATGRPPEQIADAVFSAIRDEKFYILTHPEGNQVIETRMQDILQGRNPTYEPVFS
jgi:NAD(P)-dependent dehydrogenase (short-subunit alcohol dehydrogenase family)